MKVWSGQTSNQISANSTHDRNCPFTGQITKTPRYYIIDEFYEWLALCCGFKIYPQTF